MKRLCIYLAYDKQSIIDKYIGYMLKEIKTCVNRLVVVCNQMEVVRGLDILECYADEIFYRENIGFDAGGFKDALCKFIGWEKVLRYDELVLINDSMFGPFKPMEEIFAQMNRKEIDFWGLTRHGECNNEDMGYIPEHIQSFFLVIGYRMLHNIQFREYWENMSYFATFRETVRQHEILFTHYFANLGFTYDSLVDTKANDSVHIINNYSQYFTLSYELIKKRNFPFLKKQQIAYDTLYQQTQENLRQAMDYIDCHTEYDINLIWDNIIRTLNMTDLQRSLHLQYIISPEKKYKNCNQNVLIVVLIAYKSSYEYVLEYLNGLREVCQIKIFSEYDEYLKDYRKKGFECYRCKLEGMSEFLASFYIYDYVCVIHDSDMTSDCVPSCIGKSNFYNIWENLIKNKEHVLSILELFQKQPRLGFLASPQPNFWKYFEDYSKDWNGRFDLVKCLLEDAKMNCPISEFKPPYRIAEDFWVRGNILRRIKRLKRINDCILPYMWSYLSQDAGFYSGIVESIEYASMNEVNMHHYLRQLATQIKREYGSFETFRELKDKLLLYALENFCGKFSKIFVYGIGEMAKRYKDILPKVDAYIITDGQPKIDGPNEAPIKYLSEIEILEDSGIVLCLNERNQRQVISLLKERGIKNFFCI